VQSIRAQKAHSLIGQIYDPRNLARAWERVKANRGASGVDGVTVARFNEKREYYLGLLHQKLKDGSYRPRPVRRVEIDKPGSTAKRALGIPTVMDRVCQQAVVQVLEPIFEPTFQEASFGYRPGRSTHKAMRRIWWQLGQAEWIVDGDIAGCFGSLSHKRHIDPVADRGERREQRPGRGAVDLSAADPHVGPTANAWAGLPDGSSAGRRVTARKKAEP